MKKLLVLMLLVPALFISCSKKSQVTLEESAKIEAYFNGEEFKSEIEVISEQYSALGLDIAVRTEGKEIVYEYTYQQEVSVSADQLKLGLESSRAAITAQIEQTEKEIGVEGLSFRYVYLNPDGSEIGSFLFSK